MPRWESSNLPILRVTAPVNAPRSWPNSSLSRMSLGMAPQLIARNRSLRRGLARWSALATSSLPVPLSPITSTLERVGATSRICSNRRSIGSERPMMLSKP